MFTTHCKQEQVIGKDTRDGTKDSHHEHPWSHQHGQDHHRKNDIQHTVRGYNHIDELKPQLRLLERPSKDNVLVAPERSVLTQLYHSTQGPAWVHKWDIRTDPCEDAWYGVTCTADGHVKYLQLNNNRLIGKIPTSIGLLRRVEELEGVQAAAEQQARGFTAERAGLQNHISALRRERDEAERRADASERLRVL